MECIHVKKLEEYHPGYRDRTLQWAKIYFKMVQGCPEFEMIESEIDKWRAISLICLELISQKPLPNNPKFFERKGWDFKERKYDKTIQTLMLHNFIEPVTQLSNECHVDKDKDKEKDKEKEREKWFDLLWVKYPNKDGKKAALRSFISSVKTEEDLKKINGALDNYCKSEKVQKGFIKNGSTWFHNWEDWVDYKLEKQQPKERML